MNIMLIYGGASCEHDISIITAGLAQRYFEGNIYCCYLDEQNNAYLVDKQLSPQSHKTTSHKSILRFVPNADYVLVGMLRRKLHIHCIVNCCHGGVGENGALAGMLSMVDIPLVGSDSIASGLTMDKILTKHLLRGANIGVVDGVAITRQQFDMQYIDLATPLGYPLIVKPATLGSSIGISTVHDEDELTQALQTAFAYDNRVLVERYIDNCTEYNCSAMRVGGKVIVSNIDMPISSGQILSFVDKYMSGVKLDYDKPTLEEALKESISELTRQIYVLFNMSGVVRVDYIVDSDGMLFVNEINTIPGSLAYPLWQDKFTAIQFGTLLVQQAISQHAQRQDIVSRYNSNVLDGTRIAGKYTK